MKIQVTIPVTVTVDYDTGEISTANGEFLAQDTAKVVAAPVLALYLPLLWEPGGEALGDAGLAPRAMEGWELTKIGP